MIEFQNPIQDQVLEKRTPQKALYIMWNPGKAWLENIGYKYNVLVTNVLVTMDFGKDVDKGYSFTFCTQI
jgi:hypothetical protein